MTKRHIVIATRESPLALMQAEMVKQALLKFHPQLSVTFLGITTQADKTLNITIDKMGGKGVFVKELEEALLAQRADIAVHSMKDVPMTLPPGLILPVMTEREEVCDAFVANEFASLMQLPMGATVGTSSLRRQLQLRAIRPDLNFQPIRGNLHTRLKKLDAGDFDALILAYAGLHRLELNARIRHLIPITESLPAAGQGALGIECREDDEPILNLIQPLNHLPTQQCVMAERAFTRELGGGCTAPVAAYASLKHNLLTLRGKVASLKPQSFLAYHLSGNPTQAEALGEQLAQQFIAKGALEVLREFNA